MNEFSRKNENSVLYKELRMGLFSSPAVHISLQFDTTGKVIFPCLNVCFIPKLSVVSPFHKLVISDINRLL